MTTTPTPSPYGNCPVCGSPGISRERRPGGNDKCANGHLYKSSESTTRTAPMSEEESINDSEFMSELCNYMHTSDWTFADLQLKALDLAKKYRG